jgi:hypothetical protein
MPTGTLTSSPVRAESISSGFASHAPCHIPSSRSPPVRAQLRFLGIFGVGQGTTST